MFDFIKKALSGSNEAEIKRLRKTVDQINALEGQMQKLSDADMRAYTGKLRERALGGESLDKLLPEAYALVREAAVRSLGQRPFDTQMIGAIVLHQGRIAEMRTGEGKTLTAALPALEAELSTAYPGMRLISDQRVSANGTGGIGSALAFVALACACACVYLAIRYGAPALVAALACCVAGTLTGGGLLCLFGWAFRASLSLTAAAAFAALWSTCAAALALGHMHAIARKPGKTRLSRAQIAQSAAPDIWRRVAAFAAPMLVGGACMLALGPGSVRAMGLALVAATLAGAVCACAFCGAQGPRDGPCAAGGRADLHRVGLRLRGRCVGAPGRALRQVSKPTRGSGIARSRVPFSSF